MRKNGSPLEKRCLDAQRGRADGVVDEVAHKSFDAWTFEHEDHGLLREKNAMPAKAGQSEPARRALARICQARSLEPGKTSPSTASRGVLRMTGEQERPVGLARRNRRVAAGSASRTTGDGPLPAPNHRRGVGRQAPRVRLARFPPAGEDHDAATRKAASG